MRARLAAFFGLGVVLVACTAAAEGPSARPASPGSIDPTAPAIVEPTSFGVETPTPTAVPSRTPSPTAVQIPPKPAGVGFSVEQQPLDAGGTRQIATVTWRSPRTSGLTIKVYNVKGCLALPTPNMPENAAGPCLVEHRALPHSALDLVATAAASAGTASWSWVDTSDCGWAGPVYERVVLAAYDGDSHSIYAIASPGRWSSMEVIC